VVALSDELEDNDDGLIFCQEIGKAVASNFMKAVY